MKSVNIKESEVEKWLNEAQFLESKLDKIKRKLEAFDLLATESNGSFKSADDSDQLDSPKTSKLGDKSLLILEILKVNGKYMKPSELRQALKDRDTPTIGWGEDYKHLYQKLPRLIKSGLIKKNPKGDKYKVAD